MKKVYHRIIQISGNVITVEAENVAYNTLAEVTTGDQMSLAQVIRLEEKRVSLQVFAGSRGPGAVSGATDAGVVIRKLDRSDFYRQWRTARQRPGLEGIDD